MNLKDKLLADIQAGLKDQIITESDVRSLLTPVPAPAASTVPEEAVKSDKEGHGKKLNVIDVLFYLAGLIFYAAIMVMAFQAGSDMPLIRSFITLGAGLLIWVVTFIIGKQTEQTDVKKGLVNSLMLTGSLAVVSGGFITTYQLVGSNGGYGNDPTMIYAIAFALVLLGTAHLLFDKVFRHIILIVFGVVLLTGAFPAILTALLSSTTVPIDVWTLISIATGVLLAYGGRLAARTTTNRAYLKGSFESLGALVILGSIYVASFSSQVAVFWEILLPLTIYGAFFISIKRRSKNFLVTGSFFLVLFLITTAFKYFSGLGVAACLILSAISILGTAFMATKINKTYIKQPNQELRTT